MDKKLLAFILVAVGLLAVVAGAVLFFMSAEDEDQKQSNNSTAKEEKPAMDKNAKTIVIYFSAQNHTKNVATKIATNLNADIFEIEPVEAYTEDDLDWTDSASRVSREHSDASLQNVALKSVSVPNWDEYETVFIGYPIWWGDSAWPVDSFVKQVNFGNKTVVPLYFPFFWSWYERYRSKSQSYRWQLAAWPSFLARCYRCRNQRLD